jgi:tRNA pseudouridine55 synthase
MSYAISMTMRSDGLVVVDKAAGWTSHDVVAKLRGVLGTKKVGHSGTLDPDATGLLLVGVGSVTRLLRFLTALPKRYVGEVVLGVETTTLDASGEVTATHDMDGVHIESVRAVAATMTGDIMQVPPMVSAVQVGGRRLHDLARAGVEVEREPRAVTVHQFSVEPTQDSLVFSIDVTCSSGTYVRSLAADLGHALGGGAHLRNLRRTEIGSFTIDAALPIDKIDVDALVDPATAVRDYERVAVSPEIAALVAHGKVLPVGTLTVHGEGPWALVDDAGALLAMYESYEPGTVKPAVVIPGDK